MVTSKLNRTGHTTLNLEIRRNTEKIGRPLSSRSKAIRTPPNALWMTRLAMKESQRH
jgi:hypothetical protein